MQDTSQKETSFNFYIEDLQILKSETEKDKEGRRWIRGLASTPKRDLQNETIDVNGIDYSYLIKYGVLNDDHKKGIEHEIGEVTECTVTKDGLYVKGFLYKGKERADYWWEHIQAVNQSGGRAPGMSVEGKIVRREGNRIMKCHLQAIALTNHPVNTDTWFDVVKSLSQEQFCSKPWLEHCDCESNASCDVGDHKDACACKNEKKALSAGGMGGALIPQSLDGKVTSTTHKSLTFQEAINFIQFNRGYSRPVAEALADAIFSENGLK